MGKCFSTENKWRCGYCMAKNAEEIKVCLICNTPRKWLCGVCNRINPGSSKACLYCVKDFPNTKLGLKQQQHQQQIVQHELSQKDEENSKTDANQLKGKDENTKPTDTGNKQTDGRESKVNDLTNDMLAQESELIKEIQSNKNETELAKTDEERNDTSEETKAIVLNDIKERRIAVIGTHPQMTTKFCNWIIGMSIFQRDVNNCQQVQVRLFGKKMKIAKTPDLASVSNPAATLRKCTDMLAPGPHVFLKLISIDNFTVEDKENFKHLNQWFGEKVFRFVIPVLYSKQNDLSNEDVDGYLNQNEDLNRCIQQCEGRSFAGAIFSSGQTKVKYLQGLTDIIDNVISRNNGLHFQQEVAEDHDWEMIMNSYREIAGVTEPGDVKILVKEEGPIEADAEKQLDRLKRGLDKLTGQTNTKM